MELMAKFLILHHHLLLTDF